MATSRIGITAHLLSNSSKTCLVALLVFLATNYSSAQKVAKVKFSAATTEVDAKLGKNTKRLLGNVIFEHGGAKMYCDSAYFYSKENSLDAFSNVYINQGDTLHLYGEFLHYEGNTKIAQVRKQVKLINQQTTLTTEALDYNISDGVGYYTNNATIINEDTELKSVVGHYYTQTDIFDFQDSVVVTHPDYTIYSDRLKYNTETEVSYFLGPTEIFGDSSYVYCERGWYNLQTDISQLNQNAIVKNTKQTVKGDSLYYEKHTGFGRAIKNVEIIDNEQDVILRGDKGVYYENIEYAQLTERAQFIQVSDEDSLYLHADTLLSEVDTAQAKFVKAYYGVRIFKSNLQGRCDSMIYSTSDSVIRLYNSPVLWSEEHQISADYIELHTKNRKPKTMYLYNSAFIISEEDTSMYNQIRGKNMTCHFKNNSIYKIDVNGNAQTLYYPEDTDGYIGVNKTECSDMVIYLKDGTVDRISSRKNPDSILYPLGEIPPGDKKLKGFKWLAGLRPMSKEDIFTK